MSKENAFKLMYAAAEDEQLTARLRDTRSFDEFKTVAKEKGFELGELSHEEMELLTGGSNGETTLGDIICVKGMPASRRPTQNYEEIRWEY